MKKFVIALLSAILMFGAFSLTSEALTFNSTIGYRPGQISATIYDGVAPYTVYISYDDMTYESIISNMYSDKFTYNGLSNGTSYWFKVVDSNGNYDVKKYTTPYVTIENIQFFVTEVKDTSIQCTWSWLDSVQDGVITLRTETGQIIKNIAVGAKTTQWTFSELTPNTTYQAFLTSSGGYCTNIATFTTTNQLSELEQMLKRVFVPDTNVDSDSDGIPDAFEKLNDSWNQLANYGPIGVAKNAAQIIGSVHVSDSDSDLPNFEVEIVKGMKIKVFNWDPFAEQIKTFRAIMAAVIWVGFFFFLIKSLIPDFKV